MVDEEQKLEHLLRENLRVAKDNNSRLKSIQRGMFWGGVLKLVVWAVIFGIPVILYFTLIQPYIEGVLDLYQGMGNGGGAGFFGTFFDIPGLNAFREGIEN